MDMDNDDFKRRYQRLANWLLRVVEDSECRWNTAGLWIYIDGFNTKAYKMQSTANYELGGKKIRRIYRWTQV